MFEMKLGTSFGTKLYKYSKRKVSIKQYELQVVSTHTSFGNVHTNTSNPKAKICLFEGKKKGEMFIKTMTFISHMFNRLLK